ncbi:MAG: 3-oxoacyl-ACP reductase FabG [Ignavibacteria bacterium]
MNSFENKVVLVTGGSRGLGRAIAEKFASNGAKVAITYKAKVDPRYFDSRKIKYFQCDSSKSEDVISTVEKVIREFGTIDVLVNNAGITKDTLIMRMSEQDWDNVINTNLKGCFLFCREAVKEMVKNQKGKIINISSIVAAAGNPGQSNYVASKAGMIGLTKSLAKELSAYDVQVNAVAPGFVETDMTAKLTEEQRQAILNFGIKRKPARPDKVADFISFLASPDSDLITGQTFIVEATFKKKDEIIHFKTEVK